MYITDRIIYTFLKILIFFSCFVFYRYFMLVFDLIRSVTDIRIFWFKSKWITNLIKIL